MPADPLSRRSFAAVVGVAALASPAGAAPADGRQTDSTIDPREIGRRHGVAVNECLRVLEGRSPASPDGARALAQQLAKNGAMEVGDLSLMDKLLAQIEAFRKSRDLKNLWQQVASLLDEAGKRSSELMRALLSIVQSSVEWCISRSSAASTEQCVAVLMNDLAGGITGAFAGIGLSTMTAFLTLPALAALGALGGAAAASLREAAEVLKSLPKPASAG
jgi:hypothetical protein